MFKSKAKKLAEAARDGKAAEIERQLSKGASPDAEDGDGTPALYWAATGGHLDATTRNGDTALMRAVFHGKADCAAALLEWGADNGE